MKKITKKLEVVIRGVHEHALKREVMAQGPTVDKDGWGKIDASAFGPDETFEVGTKTFTREEFVPEEDDSASSGAVTNAYRAGWDAVFGKGKRGQS